MKSKVFLSSSLEDLTYTPYGKDGLTLVFCLRGQLRLRLGDKDYTIQRNDMLRYTATTPPGDIASSEDCEVRIYIIELHSLDAAFYHCLRSEGDWWNKWNFVAEHHIIHMDERQRAIGTHFHELIRLYADDENYDYRDEALELIKQIFVYEILMWIKNTSKETASPRNPKRLLSRDAIMMQFMHLIEEHYKTQREVQWYAEQIHITPKYLSDVVKHVTGKTAIHIIREYTIKEIENQLLNTEKSIKQIAYEMNFPSLSFFSKYVHQYMGAGPADIRAGKRK